MHLSQLDLRSLSGLKQPSAIARWLKANGFVYVLGADGWPRVARSHYELRMNGDVRNAKRVEPNRKALQEMQHGRG